MYKVLLTFAILFAIFSSYLVVTQIIPRKPKEEVLSISEVKISPFEVLKKPLYFSPKAVLLGDEKKQINIEEIGLEEDGRLEVPSVWNNAGWYKGSAKPGENGNLIIDGHYDSSGGNPAAFWGLKNLKVDDTVVLTDELGRTFSYQVTEVSHIDIKDPERTSVFAETNDATITLITCGGVWDPYENTYNKRLVVKGKLSSSSILESSTQFVN